MTSDRAQLYSIENRLVTVQQWQRLYNMAALCLGDSLGDRLVTGVDRRQSVANYGEDE